ncbi:MFS transporter [Streptomyces rectiverticillatus]|uniref:MFS transporter n=1 Tax=Streptomyces rectiverticillatus TaxID=173860 RepID=UPI0015C30AFC|nr:MFS transporter [Streptomyces rectiverticillatus]QLE74890.1 MFS transporter [Streptomyces rectiverticillatus]
MSYADLLRGPHVTRLLLGTLVGRLPSAMASVAVPLALRQAGASYGFVGVAVGVFAIASAIGGPLLGRLVDRAGQPLVLLPTALVAAVGFAVVAIAPGSRTAVLAGVALAGAATPPLEPCLRALWPDIVAPGKLEAAYALDSASQELVFVGGPLVVAGGVAVASPAAALWAGALLGIAGVLVVATAPPARVWKAPARSGDRLGPLRSRGLVVLLTGLTGAGVAIGTLNVLVVHYAEDHRLPGGAPTLLALNALGALIGGLAYGAVRHWRVAPPRRTLLLMLGLTAGYGLLCLLPAPPLMAGLMILTGLFLAPVLTVVFVLVGELAPAGTVTEAFAWLVTLMTAGVALGSAVVGTVLETAGPTWAASCGVAGLAVGALVILAGQAHLVPAVQEEAEEAPARAA